MKDDDDVSVVCSSLPPPPFILRSILFYLFSLREKKLLASFLLKNKKKSFAQIYLILRAGTFRKSTFGENKGVAFTSLSSKRTVILKKEVRREGEGGREEAADARLGHSKHSSISGREKEVLFFPEQTECWKVLLYLAIFWSSLGICYSPCVS